MNAKEEFYEDSNQRNYDAYKKGESFSFQEYPIDNEINAIDAIVSTAMDELKITTLLAHTLAGYAIKAMVKYEIGSKQEPLNAEEIARWTEYTHAIIQILDQLGMNLQAILNQKIGQEGLEDIVEKYKTRINQFIERR